MRTLLDVSAQAENETAANATRSSRTSQLASRSRRRMNGETMTRLVSARNRKKPLARQAKSKIELGSRYRMSKKNSISECRSLLVQIRAFGSVHKSIKMSCLSKNSSLGLWLLPCIYPGRGRVAVDGLRELQVSGKGACGFSWTVPTCL